MNILATIKREERKLEKQLNKLQGELEGVRNAAKALGRSTNRSVKKLSAEARAQISKAQKRRWAKVRAGIKKAVS
jgi:predicted  nucleic acid-binding Zn-ribbon protein